MVDTQLTGKLAWYKSKTIWAAVATGIVGVYEVLIPILTQFGVTLPSLNSGLLATILSILSALGIYSRNTATQKIG